MKSLPPDRSTRPKTASTAQTASREGAPCSVMELPPCLIMDILSRLPLKTQFNCRRVCKTWLHVISDPFFFKLQLARSPTAILSYTFFGIRNRRELRFARIVEEVNGNSLFAEEMEFVPKINLPNPNFKLLNCCNGLICLFDTSRTLYCDIVHVCNPILGEYITIPVAYKDDVETKCFGLGFSSRTNQYKILQTFYPKQTFQSDVICPLAEIYTVGTGRWRSIGNALRGLGDLDFNTSLHGSIHWVRCNFKEICDFIYAFDFENEQFRSIPLPPHCHEKENDDEFVKLGVLKGCLSLSFSPHCGLKEFDIWVMEDYGVKESWTKQFVIENLDSICAFYEPLICLSKGRILMDNGDGVVCYHTEEKRFVDAGFCQFCQARGEDDYLFAYNYLCAYTPCFVSLRDNAKGEPWTVSRS